MADNERMKKLLGGFEASDGGTQTISTKKMQFLFVDEGSSIDKTQDFTHAEIREVLSPASLSSLDETQTISRKGTWRSEKTSPNIGHQPSAGHKKNLRLEKKYRPQEVLGEGGAKALLEPRLEFAGS